MSAFSHPAISLEPLEIDLPKDWRISPFSFVPSRSGKSWSAWAVSPDCLTSALLIGGALREEQPVAEQHRESAKRLFVPVSETGEKTLSPFEKKEKMNELKSLLKALRSDTKPGVDPNDDPVISPDGRRVSYVVRTSESIETLYLDGRPFETEGSVRDMGYSPDSRRFFATFSDRINLDEGFGGYSAEDPDESDEGVSTNDFLIVDGRRYPGKNIFFLFSDDSRHFAAGMYLHLDNSDDDDKDEDEEDEHEGESREPKSLGCFLHDGEEVLYFVDTGYIRAPKSSRRDFPSTFFAHALLSPGGEVLVVPGRGTGYADGKFARPKEDFIAFVGSKIEPVQIPNLDILSGRFPTRTTFEGYAFVPEKRGTGLTSIQLLRADLEKLRI